MIAPQAALMPCMGIGCTVPLENILIKGPQVELDVIWRCVMIRALTRRFNHFITFHLF